ncbi:cellobiose phosphorylase [Roseateles toxinivorans]|uniref:Cellobiose phosphorylase n=2 Tax=Roseateles toxinivorans TaxID=270368 RepID=A0A4R6QMK6_9BURK|nr:cellobiose phosphorylase [Roseateles toxinivorans]
MPGLLMHEPAGGLLQRVSATALRAQRAFGERHRVPWGVSECAYFEQDASLAFQYGPFGVPELAMRRTPLEERVIAPYASLLALPLDMAAALNNLHGLERLGARGPYGFIEALDFSAARRSEGAKPQRVATHMSHHQGMGLLALCNLLCDGAPQGWFGRSPRARAHEILLHERMPRAIVFQSLAIPRMPHQHQAGAEPGAARNIDPATGPSTAMPTLLLGNGGYNLCLRPNGAGQSRWRGQAINRGRDDALRDPLGQWLLLRRAGAPTFHSLTLAPCADPQARYQTRFFADHAEFEARSALWESSIDVWVSPDDDVELRSLSLHNLSDDAAEFELLSFFEVALTAQRADESHPAFAKLFVRAHGTDPGCLLLERRPRLETESGMWMAHFLAAEVGGESPGAGSESDASIAGLQVSCDRAGLLPRCGGLEQLGSADDAPDGKVDTGLDPAASLRLRLRLPAHARRTLTFGTAAAADAAGVLAIVDEYRQAVHLTQARLKGATLARIRQRELRLSIAELQLMQDLNTPMTLSCARPRPAPEAPLDRRALWRLAISGDRPIALIWIDSLQGMRVARLLMTAHRFWDMHGLCGDLVLINAEPPSYLQPLQHQLLALRQNVGLEPHALAERGAIHLLQQDRLEPGELAALRACARIDLRADGRSLARLLADAHSPGRSPQPVLMLPRPPLCWPVLSRPGRFSADGRAFEFEVDARQLPPRPWCNVLANADMGCVLSETGGGYTWARNSRLHQLTPWSNDALLDPPGEHLLVLDEASGQVFGLMPGIDRNGDAGYRVEHGPGHSQFMQRRAELEIRTEVMVHPPLAAKCIQVHMRSTGEAPKRLRLLAMVEWVMGAQARDRMSLLTESLADPQLLLAQQLDHSGGFGAGCAYLMLAGAPVLDWTCARDEFFANHGAMQWPQALGRQQGFGLDPCAALATSVTLMPGQTFSCSWVLGYGPGREAALVQAAALGAPGALQGWAGDVDRHWRELLSAVTVQTPDAGFDALVNHWLLYQTLACRLWAKAGFYQASGATGFRDQLQDAMALGVCRPALLRQQLLVHAARQFPQGDVQHWWHEPGGAGVRTRFSDDLLWLPYALQHYLRVSDDSALLDEQLPFLAGAEVPEHAEDAYYTPEATEASASLYEHAARAIDHALRWGEHGLPLMGCGDWNDGMNRVGHHGRGESVWLAWFLLVILADWPALARARQDDARVQRWEAAATALRRALAEHGWDGAWYRRAYFDNGHALGSSANAECRIDLIAQAWSVFAAPAGDARAAQAMRSVDALLVDRQVGLIRLLDPPLQLAADHAGYIQAYPPGVRENGGQYSHAAAWAVLAQARLGHAELAWEYFRMLSPAHRAADLAGQRRYAIEPYVMPGDTYSAAPYQGRGGWSWYTGSAAWMYRAALEGLLGLQLEARRFMLQPCIPPEWRELRIRVRHGGARFELLLRRQGPERAAPPASTRQIRAGEWMAYDDLPPDQLLLLVLPTLPGREEPSAPSAPNS